MTDDELVDATFAASPHGAALRAQLAEHGVATPPRRRAAGAVRRRVPGTPDRKIHLVPEALDREAPDGLYSYQPDPGQRRVPARADLAGARDPDQLDVRPAAHRARRSSSCRRPTPRRAASRPATRVRVWNARGEVRCLAKVATDVRDGVCVLPKGLWRKHTAQRLHRERADPAERSPISAARPRTTTRASRSRRRRSASSPRLARSFADPYSGDRLGSSARSLADRRAVNGHECSREHRVRRSRPGPRLRRTPPRAPTS